jgi:FKBP-type peptidyl-prolyl cis-trans isomerase SlyD
VSAFQIGPQTFVTLSYHAFDAEGEVASEPEVLGYVFGMGGLLPEVERALDGRIAGDKLQVRLAENQAYGARNPKGILEVDREDFPEDVAAGDRFEVENEQGGVLVLHVLDVQADVVVVDTNHPLSGQEVSLSIEVLEVRPAEQEEIEAALLCLEDDALADRGTASSSLVPDVRVSDLLRRRPSH